MAAVVVRNSRGNATGCKTAVISQSGRITHKFLPFMAAVPQHMAKLTSPKTLNPKALNPKP